MEIPKISEIYRGLFRRLCLFALSGVVLISCSHEVQTIKIPDNCELLNQLEISNLSDYLSKDIKIVVYADSTGCTGCRLQLDTWEYAISEFNEIASGRFSVLYFLETTNKQELLYVLGYDEELYDEELYDEQTGRFHYPIFFDPNGYFRTLNDVSQETVFIINDKNEVLYQGPPPFIKDVRDKYIHVISNYFIDNE